MCIRNFGYGFSQMSIILATNVLVIVYLLLCYTLVLVRLIVNLNNVALVAIE